MVIMCSGKAIQNVEHVGDTLQSSLIFNVAVILVLPSEGG